MEYMSPSGTLDFQMDWTSWLSDGDSISTSIWSGGGLTVSSEAIASPVTSCSLTDPIATYGKTYKVENVIQTVNGVTANKLFFVRTQKENVG